MWASAAPTNLNKIERAINILLRKVRRARWYFRNSTIRRDLNIPSMKESIVHLSEKFYDRIQNINNEIIAELPDYDISLHINRRRPRATLLLLED